MNIPPTATPRLAIVATHPIQYYAPWFAQMAARLRAHIEVFYLWDFGVEPRHDPGFDRDVRWDVDLLSGYSHRFVENTARRPGTSHFFGLRNPTLVDQLAAWKPDAILLFGYRYWSHLRVISSRKLRRVPILFRGDSHLLAESRCLSKKAAKRLALRILFRRFAAFLPVGLANAQYFRRHGVPSVKLFRVPHAVDDDRFSVAAKETLNSAAEWRHELKIRPDSQVILFAGKFETKKRPDHLIRAFRSARVPGSVLLLVGAGALETKLKALAGDSPDIRFVPFQNQSAMPRVYAASDLVVLPSVGPGETWGLVINEACGLGWPVITSDHVGCHPDLVRSGKNGLVFPAGDVGALRDALILALSDKARLREWGSASRELIRGYTYRHATCALQRALTSVLPASR